MRSTYQCSCVLQFTLWRAFSCGLHRSMSRVIPCRGWLTLRKAAALYVRKLLPAGKSQPPLDGVFVQVGGVCKRSTRSILHSRLYHTGHGPAASKWPNKHLSTVFENRKGARRSTRSILHPTAEQRGHVNVVLILAFHWVVVRVQTDLRTRRLSGTCTRICTT